MTQPRADTDRHDAHIRLALGGLLSLAAAIGIGRFIYTPILPSMVSDLGWTQGDAGLLASANYVGYMIGAVAAAFRGLPGSPRAWLIASLGVSAVSTAAMAVTHNEAAFILLRLINGATGALVLVFASSLVLDRLNAAGRGNLSALHFAGVGTGIAISSLIAWSALEMDLGWRGMWAIGGAISIAAAIVVALFVPDASCAIHPSPAQTRTSAADAPQWSPALTRLTLAYTLFGFAYIITATFIVAIVRETPSLRPAEPLVWLTVGLAGAPSVAVWAIIVRRTSIITAYCLACLAEAVGIAISVLGQTPEMILLASVLLGGTFMAITAFGLMAARALAGNAARAAIATLTAAFGVGQIIGPLVAGYGYDITGSFLAPSMLAVAFLVLSAVLAATVHAIAPSTSGATAP